tara:strand:- start:1358 stop:2323 length:966 start_codon:yes stop_codon:yes gene_type:complete
MNSNSWDKFLLLAAAVVVIGLSGMFVFKSMGYGDIFQMSPATPDSSLPDTDVGRADIARKFVESTSDWKTKRLGDGSKPVPLFVSIPIVESNGTLIDMTDPNAPILRPPVSNIWLIDNNLDYLNSNVLRLDPDGDGFSSSAEWESKTDPSDPGSHPPYADKLAMVSRQQSVYKLKFSAKPDAERFQIMRIATAKWPKRENFYLKVGEISSDQQFRVDSFEEKTGTKNGISVDATEVFITHLPKQEKHILVRNVEYDIPTYYAELTFLLDPGNNFYVKEGETFNLVQDPETKYRVTKVNEDSVTITYQTGSEPEQTVEINKK